MTTVRLAFMRRFPEAVASGLLLGIAGIAVIVYTGASKHFLGWLLGGACVVGLAAAVPLVRLLVRRRIPWQAVQGLHLGFRTDRNGYSSVTVRISLSISGTARPGIVRRLRSYPLVGRMQTTRMQTTRRYHPLGKEPRAVADLFALFGDRGVPIGGHEYVNAILARHGRPALPTSSP